MAIVILRTGDAIPHIAARRGEFGHWIMQTVGHVWTGDWVEFDARSDGALPTIADADAFIITGSSASVTERAAWMLRCEEYIRAIVAAQVPLLGICFGHQIVAQALGGHVSRNPRGREIGTITVDCHVATDPLFGGLSERFGVNATHVDSVAALPPDAQVLASTAIEPTAAFAVGATTRCVQFHPEIDADLMRGYVEARAQLIEQEGLCSKTISSGVRDTPDGVTILRNFISKFVVARRSRAA